MEEKIIQAIAEQLFRAKPVQFVKEEDKEKTIKNLKKIAKILFHIFYNSKVVEDILELENLPKLELYEGIPEILQDELRKLNSRHREDKIAFLIEKCQVLTMRFDRTLCLVSLEDERKELRKQGKTEEEILDYGDLTPIRMEIKTMWNGPRIFVKAPTIAEQTWMEETIIDELRDQEQEKKADLSYELVNEMIDFPIGMSEEENMGMFMHPALMALRTSKAAYLAYLEQRVPVEKITNQEYKIAERSYKKPSLWARRKLDYLADQKPWILRQLIQEKRIGKYLNYQAAMAEATYDTFLENVMNSPECPEKNDVMAWIQYCENAQSLAEEYTYAEVVND